MDLYQAIANAVRDETADKLTDFEVDIIAKDVVAMVNAREDEARQEGWADGYFEGGGLGG